MSSRCGDTGYEEIVRRLALVVASGNNDAHLKNWSLLYRDGATPSLAPVYDQLATVAWQTLDRTLALKLAGAREFSRVNADSFRRLARKVQVSPERTLELARETLTALQKAWKLVAQDAPMFEDRVAALLEHWRHVPLLREAGGLSGNIGERRSTDAAR